LPQQLWVMLQQRAADLGVVLVGDNTAAAGVGDAAAGVGDGVSDGWAGHECLGMPSSPPAAADVCVAAAAGDWFGRDSSIVGVVTPGVTPVGSASQPHLQQLLLYLQ
jgi:hypothetical protein